MTRAVTVLLRSLKEYFLNLCDALKEVVAAGLMRTSGRTLWGAYVTACVQATFKTETE